PVWKGRMIMRERRVGTGKRTMFYMSTSVALTAGGIILGYLLLGVHHIEGKTMNWTLAKLLAGNVHPFALPLGDWFVVATLASEALLLFAAAPGGFIAGPRAMGHLAPRP